MTLGTLRQKMRALRWGQRLRDGHIIVSGGSFAWPVKGGDDLRVRTWGRQPMGTQDFVSQPRDALRIAGTSWRLEMSEVFDELLNLRSPQDLRTLRWRCDAAYDCFDEKGFWYKHKGVSFSWYDPDFVSLCPIKGVDRNPQAVGQLRQKVALETVHGRIQLRISSEALANLLEEMREQSAVMTTNKLKKGLRILEERGVAVKWK